MNGLQLSDADPSRGLQLRLATTWYGDQRFASRCVELRVLRLMSKVLFERYQGETRSLERLLLENLASKLRSGQLYATGLRVGEYTSVTIPHEWWGVATLNEETNTAEGNGVTFSGLLIFETAPEKAEASKPSSELDRACAWMREHVTSYVANQRDDRVSECISAIGVRKPAAIAGWKALDEHVKGPSRLPK